MSEVDADILACVLFLASPIFIFWGQLTFRWIVGALGFVFGGYGAYLLLQEYASISVGLEAFIIFAAAVVGCLLVMGVVLFGVFVCGALAGILLGNAIVQLVAAQRGGVSDATQLGVVIACAVIVGVIAVLCMNQLLRLLTAFVGGYMFVSAIDHLTYRVWNQPPSLDASSGFFRHPRDFQCNDTECYVLLGVWAFLFAIGTIVQTLHARARSVRASSS